ncbi:MAG: tetratricopeptide repeat protein [Caldilinea sp.]
MGALANLKLQAGDLAAARDLAEEAQALRRQIGHRHSLGVILELLARIARKENKPAEAAVFYQEAILVFDSMGNQPSAAQMRAALAALTTV